MCPFSIPTKINRLSKNALGHETSYVSSCPSQNLPMDFFKLAPHISATYVKVRSIKALNKWDLNSQHVIPTTASFLKVVIKDFIPEWNSPQHIGSLLLLEPLTSTCMKLPGMWRSPRLIHSLSRYVPYLIMKDLTLPGLETQKTSRKLAIPFELVYVREVSTKYPKFLIMLTLSNLHGIFN